MKKLLLVRRQILSWVAAGWLTKYSVSVGLFVVWMLFFDKHNLITQFQLRSSVQDLERDIEMYRNKLAETEAAHLDLITNKEKFAREKYLMHREDEDIYIFQ